MSAFTSQRGSSMVEFSIASAALMLLIFGMVEFGRAMYAYHAVANAARIGSRWAMVRGSQSCNYPTGQALSTCPATSDEIRDYVRSTVPMDDTKKLNVSVTWPSAGSPCDVDSQHAGCTVSVTATNEFDFAVPFVSNAAWTISSTSQMVISQ